MLVAIRFVTISLLTLLTGVMLYGAPEPAADEIDPDMQLITQRLYHTLLDVDANGLPALQSKARALAASITADGRWTDIDYADRGRTKWAPLRHMDNLLLMAQAYQIPGQSQYHDAALRTALLAGFDQWINAECTSENWWYNDIGAPRTMARVLLLLHDVLSPQQRVAGLALLNRHPWPQWNTGWQTGQNLVWGVDIQIIAGCLERDVEKIKTGFQRLAQEIVMTDSQEGIQADNSFHQHGAQLYSGGYGQAFAGDCALYAALARGTRFAFAPEKIALLTSYMLEGQQWMVHGRTFDYSAVGREITRAGISADSLLRACADMALAHPARADAFQTFAHRITHPAHRDDPALIGNRHFWKSDLMTHHRQAYSSSVRLTSSRLLKSEIINGEGKRSHYLADGAHYLYRTGDEYRDIFPVWDWRRVPGVTVEYAPDPFDPKMIRITGERRFAGGVSDGRYGLAAMDFARGTLTAKKAWFFFDDEIVCLGAGITCPGAHPVVTSVNQCLLSGPVTVSDGRGIRQLDPGTYTFNDLRWAQHDGIGYVPLRSCAVHLTNTAQHGSWAEIGAGSPTRISRDVFSLWLDHGAQPDNQSYAYLVTPGMTATALAGYAAAPPVRIIDNSAGLQAVSHPALGLLAAACYQPGRITADDMTIAVDHPCLLLLQQTAAGIRLTVSNPENSPLTLQVEINRRLQGPECHWDAERGITRIRLTLPDGADAGRSVTRVLPTP